MSFSDWIKKLGYSVRTIPAPRQHLVWRGYPFPWMLPRLSSYRKFFLTFFLTESYWDSLCVPRMLVFPVCNDSVNPALHHWRWASCSLWLKNVEVVSQPPAPVVFQAVLALWTFQSTDLENKHPPHNNVYKTIFSSKGFCYSQFTNGDIEVQSCYLCIVLLHVVLCYYL